MSPRSRRFFGCLVPVILVVAAVATCAMTAYATQVLLVVVDIEDTSMAPALPRGQTVIVDNTEFWAQNPFRGQIVYTEGEGRRQFRRLVALPGDTLEVKSGRITINGTLIEESYARGTGSDFGPIVLGEDEFFVLADDRGAADSRIWGPLPRKRLYGIPSVFRDPDRGFANVLHDDYTDQVESAGTSE